MRASRYAALAIGTVLGPLLALPCAPTVVADGSHASPPRRARPAVALAASMWTVQSTPQAIEVRTTYPESTPPQEYVGKPVDIQQMRPDGSWETIGTAEQQQVEDAPKTTATVEFSFAAAGRNWLRARSHPTSGTVTSAQQLIEVRTDKARFDPTALTDTGDCDGSQLSGLQTIVYSCGQVSGHRHVVAYNQTTGERTVLTRRTTLNPLVADRAPVATVESVDSDGDGPRNRALRVDLRDGKVGPLAYDRAGRAVNSSDALALSDDGKLAVYASAARNIVRGAPKGSNIYLKRQGRKRSTHIGRGRWAQISGNGSFVVWRTPANVLRRTNLASGRTVTLRGAHPTGAYAGPTISRNGRYVAYAELGKDRKRRVHVTDMRAGTTWSAGRGSLPTLAPDGEHVAFRSASGTAVLVWSRTTKRRVLVSVGLNGDGTGNPNDVESPDFSASGRWLISYADSGLIAPDNGRNEYDGWNNIVLFDLAELEEDK